jgi:phosphatidylserine decarboxylase
MKFNLGSGYILSINSAGTPFIFIGFVLFLTSTIFFGFNVFSFFLLILTMLCMSFFRDPERFSPNIPNAIISPADGIVSNILYSNISIPKELDLVPNKISTKVSIFLSVADVHVNRIPVDGKIIEIKYHPGKFLNASLDKASDHNERNSIVIETESGDRVICCQIAGLIARRIICDSFVGDQVEAGSRYGIIRFGSRMDIYLPNGYKLNIKKGQRMVGGETVIAIKEKE